MVFQGGFDFFFQQCLLLLFGSCPILVPLAHFKYIYGATSASWVGVNQPNSQQKQGFTGGVLHQRTVSHPPRICPLQKYPFTSSFTSRRPLFLLRWCRKEITPKHCACSAEQGIASAAGDFITQGLGRGGQPATSLLPTWTPPAAVNSNGFFFASEEQTVPTMGKNG